MGKPQQVQGFIAGALNAAADRIEGAGAVAGAGMGIKATRAGRIISRITDAAGRARAPMPWDVVRSLRAEGSHCVYDYFVIIGNVADELGTMCSYSDDISGALSATIVSDVYAQCNSGLYTVYNVDLGEVDIKSDQEIWLAIKRNDKWGYCFCLMDQEYSPYDDGTGVFKQPVPLLSLRPFVTTPIARISGSAIYGVAGVGSVSCPLVPDADSLVCVDYAMLSCSVWRAINHASTGSDVLLSQLNYRPTLLQLYAFDASDRLGLTDRAPGFANDLDSSDGGLWQPPYMESGAWPNLLVPYRRDWQAPEKPYWIDINYIYFAALFILADKETEQGETIDNMANNSNIGVRSLGIATIFDASSSCSLSRLGEYNLILRTPEYRMCQADGAVVEENLDSSVPMKRYLRCSGDRYDADGNLILYVATGADQYVPFVSPNGTGDVLGVGNAVFALEQTAQDASDKLIDIRNLSDSFYYGIEDINDALDSLEEQLESFEDRVAALEAL